MNLKRVKLPHTLVLIYIMVVLTVVATWVVPGGEYQKVEKDGRLVPVPNSFHLTERHPQGIGALFISPLKGFVEASLIIVFCFVSGGVFGIIQKTGAVSAFIHNLSLKFGRSKSLQVLLIPMVMILFSLGGAIWGMCEETMPFILVFVPLSLSLGYDTIVGVAMPFIGAASGFAGAFFNPFTVGIAQGIAGLPLYSGLGYRMIVWVIGTVMAIFFVTRYASKVRKNPRMSPTFEEDEERRKTLAIDFDSHEKIEVTKYHKRVLYVFLITMFLLVYGILRYKWYMYEIAGLFLALGIFAGIAGRLKTEEMARSFVEGAKDMMNAALIIGCARGMLVVATDGRILDTTLFYMAKTISRFHPVISSELMFASQCVINFFVHSGTGQAALTMPIMAPLGDLVGITRQTSVFAYQLCEYINPVLPTSGVTMGVMGLARLRWEKWARWLVPLLIAWVALSAVALVPAVLSHWGPR